MIKKFILAVTICTMAIPSFVTAQNDKEVIQELITNFSKDVEKLVSKGASEADKVISYASPNFKYTHTVINISNIVTTESFNKESASFMLHQMRSRNMKSVRKLGSLDKVYVRNNLALALYDIDYELYESDRMINKGYQTNQMILRKGGQGEWKIESVAVLSVDDITYKSTCICEIYETKGLSSIMTETIVPDGHEADILEDKFSVDASTNPRTVRHGFRDYLWETKGGIYNRNPDGSQGEQIGVAVSRQEMLLTLLKKEVYPDRCNNVIRKIK